MTGRRVTVALVVAVTLGMAPQASSAQYIEPAPRRPGVAVPVDHLAAMAAQAARLGLPQPGLAPAPAKVARTGTRGMVVIPALFADSPEPFLSSEDMQTALFDGPAPRGTVSQFYADQSHGVFTIDGEVTPWVRTSITLQEAAGSDGTFGERMGEYLTEAVALADAQVDFGQFDNDGADGVPNSGDDDGTVDGIAIQFLEIAGSCGGPGIWPHLGGLFNENGQPYETQDKRPNGDPIVIQLYIADSATDCSGTHVQGPEVMAHELGHLIGLPDYYRKAEGLEPWQRHWAVGCFDTMGAGSWGCGTGSHAGAFGPTGFSAYSRAVLGWSTLETVTDVSDQEFTLEPLSEGHKALEIPLDAEGNESLIVEYRTQTGYDKDLPAGGVLIYHRDNRASTTRWIPPDLPPAYSYNLVEADGDNALLKVERLGGNRGVAGDVFARDGAVDSLTDTSIPSTRDHLGRPTRVRLRDIRIEDGLAHLRISTDEGFAVTQRQAPTVMEGGRPYQAIADVEGATLPLDVTPLDGSAVPAGFDFSVSGSSISVTGTLRTAGPFHVSLRVRDADGHELVEHFSATVVDPQIDETALVQAAAGLTAGVTDDEAAYLDAAGNANGHFDVGDLRATLRRRGILFQPVSR